MKFQALLLDVNGVQVDSKQLMKESNIITFGKFGYDLTEEEYNNTYLHKGKYSEGIIKDNKLPLNYSEFKAKRGKVLEELISQKGLEPIAGIHRVLAEVKELKPNMLIASVSNNYQKEVNLFHKEVGLTGKFDLIITKEMFEYPKPHPSPYLTAIKELCVKPENCLVIENTGKGIISAKEAGIKKILATPDTKSLEYEISDIKPIWSLEEVHINLINYLERELEKELEEKQSIAKN
tara:strand:- start:3445 stop:4152 length:708 start_codon:yes stop_codon:yes gene_type:complete